MEIFDAHAHLGYDVVFDEEVTEQMLLTTYEKCGVDGALVQPFLSRPYLEDTREIHDRIYRLTQEYPGKFYGMVSICPHLYPHVVEEECRRCIVELHFKGIKIATTAHGVNPSGKDGMHIFEIAENLKVPVMVHTGGGNFGMPHLLEKPAKTFPSVPIVIAHGGGEEGVAETIRLAKTYEQIFVEPSWINRLSMEKFAKELGAGKLMFSSDMPQNTFTELMIFQDVFPKEEDRVLVLGQNAKKVFQIL